ncbi:MAG: flagellar hook-basal body complex protein FliE [Planctomycetaceae bacterium]|nr:flagellar hook-basal body complex protein FliE [Planctomycetaceae bacterium]
MSVSSIQTPGLLPQSIPLPVRDSKSANGSLPFAEMVKGLITETDQQQLQSQDSVRQLITGETDSIHDVVLTTSRADLAFRLMMEIRNRLIESYQEVMRMQV